MLKLYYSPGACSLSPHIALCEAGLTADLVRVDLATKKTADGGDFLAVNPDGYVPVLRLENGNLLTEGPAIVQYIADLVPEKGLAPANGTPERYRLQSVLNFISTELHKSFSLLFAKTESADLKEFARNKLASRFDRLQERLTGDFVCGSRFTVADGYLFTVLRWCKVVGINLADWPRLAAYHSRIAQRPAVEEALKAENLVR